MTGGRGRESVGGQPRAGNETGALRLRGRTQEREDLYFSELVLVTRGQNKPLENLFFCALERADVQTLCISSRRSIQRLFNNLTDKKGINNNLIMMWEINLLDKIASSLPFNS